MIANEIYREKRTDVRQGVTICLELSSLELSGSRSVIKESMSIILTLRNKLCELDRL